MESHQSRRHLPHKSHSHKSHLSRSADRFENRSSSFRDRGTSAFSCKKNHHEYICGKAEQAFLSQSSSTSGATDLSVRIRKSRGCTERRLFICVSLGMIFTVLLASIGIYFGYSFLRARLPETEIVFSGQFKVNDKDFLKSEQIFPGSFLHGQQARIYQRKLDNLFQESQLSKKYIHSDVFLIEKHKKNDVLTIHFNVHMNPETGKIGGKEIENVILQEIENHSTISYNEIKKSPFGDLVIQPESVIIQERDSSYVSSRTQDESRQSLRNDDKSCIRFQNNYCKYLPYNFTTFPNALHHQNYEDASQEMNLLKEIVDSKCYSFAYEFLCQLLHPLCYKAQMILPCKDFCEEFLNSCSSIIPPDFFSKIQCSTMKTEAEGPGACTSKPGCVTEMRNKEREKEVCDGVVDCPDFSDELYCPYCPETYFHCGIGKHCISQDKLCDGHSDCMNGADERGCLLLSPQMNSASYVHEYYSSGYLIYQKGGEAGKVCAEHINVTVPSGEMNQVLNKLGVSMCELLEYRQLKEIVYMKDAENGHFDYVDMIGPMNDEKQFIRVPCSSKEVLHISCSSLNCGQRPAYASNKDVSKSIRVRKEASHGDWPWHVALFKDDVHVCDGTLFHDQWILTTVSCFQGQEKAKWTARFATIRLQSRAPWEQRRRIVGMMKSPVEGNSLVILKMDSSLQFSDFSRPVCLPPSDEFVHLGSTCVTLGWNTQNGQLHVVPLEPAKSEICNEEGEMSHNAICTQALNNETPCLLDELSGSPLLCLTEGAWHIVGVSSWRVGCSKSSQRPRVYDKVSLNYEWIHDTILKMN